MARRRRRAAAAIVIVLAVAVAAVVVATLALGSTPIIGQGEVDGPVSTSDRPGIARSGNDAIVAGTLVQKGDCALLESEGSVHAVLWPYGTSWDESTRSVRLSSGTLVGSGDRVSGGGGYLTLAALDAGAAPVQSQVIDDLHRCTTFASEAEIAVFNAGSTVDTP